MILGYILLFSLFSLCLWTMKDPVFVKVTGQVPFLQRDDFEQLMRTTHTLVDHREVDLELHIEFCTAPKHGWMVRPWSRGGPSCFFHVRCEREHAEMVKEALPFESKIVEIDPKD